MLYLTCSWAIFQRLTGFPLDSVGNPLLDPKTRKPVNQLLFSPPDVMPRRRPSYGVRIPEPVAGYDVIQDLSTKSPNGARLFEKGFKRQAFRQVPVFIEGIKGRPWESVWPCVVVRWVDEQPRATENHYYDPFEGPDENSPHMSIYNGDGEVIAGGRTQRYRRPHPNGVDMLFDIRIYSKHIIEVGLIVEAVKRLFPQKTAIEIEQADGTTHTCDMLLDRQSVEDATGGVEGAGKTLENERYMCRVLRYRIEAYEDNTQNAFGSEAITYQSVVLNRVVEVQATQSILATQPVNLDAIDIAPEEDT